ncbi:winged helix-turn-helix domain-containing protein [Nocardia farcinica]|nr:winged helix-turn-helix domain-containing protein [Nocardia farcinica]
MTDGMCAHQRGLAGPAPTLTSSGDEAIVVGLLGEVALRRDAALVPVPGVRARLLLTALALRPGRHRGATSLIEDVWGDSPPRAPMNALHTQVSRLRAALPDGAVEAGPAGYRLLLRPAQVDLARAGELLALAREHVRGANGSAGDLAAGLAAVSAARALWRGEPAADLPPGPVTDDLRTAAGALAADLDAVELTLREADGDTEAALRIARRAAAADPLSEPAQLALLRLLAATGRPTEALESFAAFRARLADELGADPGPALVAMNTAILRGEPVVPVPPAASAGPARDAGHERAAAGGGAPTTPGTHPAIGLRAAPNPLLGREADLTALLGLVEQARVVTVLGPGGTGKTRIANELGARMTRREPVVLVELASVRSGPGADARVEVEAAISATLGLGEVVREPGGLLRPGRVDFGRRLREALAARPILLILDNCEHLVDAVAAVVADLIGACEHLTVVTTSRAPLAITAETVYPLDPLAIDPAGSPATELFAARARAVRPTVRLDPEVVARLCAMLDGLPLAIELAAARTRTMSVEEIERRLEHRFALLRSGDRTSPERHRTLHAVIAWSWNLLDEPQQRALRRMCRFPAGFTLAAAEIVAGGPDAAEAIEGLVSQSLLTVLEGAEGTGVRYRMLETVREFGEEQLGAEEADLVVARMAAWGRSYARDALRRYRAAEQLATVHSVAEEVDNLVAVLRAAADRGDGATAYRVFPVAGLLWMMRGAHLDLLAWAPRVLDCLPEGDDPAGIDADLHMLACLLIAVHTVYISAEARPFLATRMRIRRLLRRARDLDPSLRLLGELACADLSGRRLPRLLAEGARSPDPDVRIAALVARANLRENAGLVHGSTRDAQRALELLRDRDPWGTALVCQHLGQLGGQTAHYAESVRHYRRAVELLRLLGAHEEIMEIRSFLAVALIADGRPQEGARELEFAFEGADRSHPAPVDDPGILRNHRLSAVAAAVAELRLAQGDVDAGLRYYHRALDLLGWPQDNLVPGPGGLMLAAAAIGAHVLHGRADRAATLADQVAVGAAVRLAQFYDLPQVGSAACAIGSWLLALDPSSATGLELLVLAARAVARQDYPSMTLRRHIDLHTPRVGADRFDAAVRAGAVTGRLAAAHRIIELLRASFPVADGAGRDRDARSRPDAQARRM